ncbi:MAG: Gfo/Idh/MocA family oxidoreductase [Pseudomonadota bacterium]
MAASVSPSARAVDRVRIAVVGAGLIGLRHKEAVKSAGHILAAIADPDPAARAIAETDGIPYFESVDALLAARLADGVIVATPNATHVDTGLACVRAGMPVLIEKPIATDAKDAERFLTAADRAGMPILVGHHRRHNPLISRAKAEIDNGTLGRIVTVQATFWLVKPDGYYEATWRRQPGAGPIFINLIHDVDLLRHLCGDVASVQAATSNTARRFDVEDSAAVILKFANGALGTVSVSDAVPAPLSWEMTARENPAYPATDQACYWIGGTEASMELPGLKIWRHAGDQSWWSPITTWSPPVGWDDPLVRQIEHFAKVIKGEALPLVSGRDGVEALKIVEAVRTSAATGRIVSL